LRVTADEPRIADCATYAPVTDWRPLEEFAALSADPLLASMALERYADRLAKRPLYLAIGDRDERVRTDLAVRFMVALLERERAVGAATPRLDFRVAMNSAGHSMHDCWYEEGARFLLSLVW
jgi:hypothetical protein